MTLKNVRRLRRFTAVAGTATAALLLSGCASAGAEYPEAHIHAMAVNPDTEQVLLATHDGLYDLSADPVKVISPAIDLMGFTTTGQPGHFYASGHPGAGVELPNPVGLIESNDGGKSWQALSRQGQSDFHSLTYSDAGIVGFDGSLRTSEEGQRWTTPDTSIQPADLSGAAEEQTVLATTQGGLQRSADGGTNWSPVPEAPLMYLTDFASAEQAAGVTPDGQVYTSDDAGLTWQSGGSIDVEPHAMAAVTGDEGQLQIWIATAQDIRVSTDGGQTFSGWSAE
ncbi:F510_1955 family glycosylhydrolase [Arthrobacter sp. H14]|uniref:F510_1955 family glycosylhydrolase n=1 Tax=Arthrobacter sp. H14 TaxID=1312959 RepID=UPI0004AF8665|nr:hypothetical protein [Arthrobacter sp. H14]